MIQLAASKSSSSSKSGDAGNLAYTVRAIEGEKPEKERIGFHRDHRPALDANPYEASAGACIDGAYFWR